MLGYRTPSFGATRAPRAPRARAPQQPGGGSAFGSSSPAFPSLTQGAHAQSFSPSDVAASLAANPQASQGGYEGVGTQAHPGPEGQTSYRPPQPTPTAPAQAAYNYDADPVLQQILGFSTSGRENAQSDAVAAKKKLAVDFNDADLATQLGDPATAQAAKGNEFGVLEALKHNYERGANQLDEQLNDNGNLFYSGYRGQQQGNLTHDYQGQVAGATGREQDLLGQIVNGLRDALLGYDAQDAQARSDAAGRATDSAVGAGTDPGANGPPPPDPGAGPAGADVASLLFPTSSTPLIGDNVGDPLAQALMQQYVPPNRRRLLDPLLG